MANISFGTDGFRGILGKDFTKENVEIIIRACAKYIIKRYGIQKQIIIGYDPRREADEYAKFATELLISFGFDVVLSEKVIPTPIIAFAAKYYNACAFMFTASHNPSEYLGVKFIPDYGGPATSEITNEISTYFDDYDFSVFSVGKRVNLYLSEPYFEHVEKIIDMNQVCKIKSSIIFDGLYSATIGYFDKFLEKYHIPFEKINCIHDPMFGGGMPDPKPKYLEDLIAKIKKTSNTIGLSNDGDGDRYGVINENGEYVTPNEIMGILLRHLIKNKLLIGDLAITVAGSTMLKILAKKMQINVIETPVGFKWLGEAMRNNLVSIAGEDSGGLSIGSHIPEKDGILANLLILEAMAYENKSLVELQKDLKAFVAVEYVQDRVDFRFANKDIMLNVIDKIDKINDFPLKRVETKYIDGIKIIFIENSWILVRASGTEPLLRVYIESKKDTINVLKSFVVQRVKSFF